jgi:hydroxymethylbilane synthase
VCREDDFFCREVCALFNDTQTALCAGIERDFLRALMGGCSTPISALAEVVGDDVVFKGNVLSTDGASKIDVEKTMPIAVSATLGRIAGNEMLANGAKDLLQSKATK